MSSTFSTTEKLHLAQAIPSPWQNSLFEAKRTAATTDIPSEIRFPNPPGTTSVEVCGDWDEWRTRTALEYSTAENIWKCTIPLPSGTYQCKFLVNDVHWVVTNMLPMLADEGGNNNNQIFVKDASQSTHDQTSSAGIGDSSPSAPFEPPPIYKMYYSEGHMRHREFTPSPSPPSQPSPTTQTGGPQQPPTTQHDQETLPSSTLGQDTAGTGALPSQQGPTGQQTEDKRLCASKCSIL